MFIRSIIFYILLSFWTIFLGLICLPFLILPSKFLRKPIILWIYGIFFLLRYVCKISHEIKGQNNIPNYAVLIASKHQSAFETLALFYYLQNSVFIHKKQLFFIPIFGQYLKKINMISINRKGGAKVMRSMLREAKKKISLGVSIIIFPEGTRKKPGDKANYKSGYVGIYQKMNLDILPVAVNSGNYWPKHSFIKKPGKIIISFLEIIPAGANRSKIQIKLKNIIEEETKKINII